MNIYSDIVFDKIKLNHKPLVITGIRQFGKTFITQHFASRFKGAHPTLHSYLSKLVLHEIAEKPAKNFLHILTIAKLNC